MADEDLSFDRTILGRILDKSVAIAVLVACLYFGYSYHLKVVEGVIAQNRAEQKFVQDVILSKLDELLRRTEK